MFTTYSDNETTKKEGRGLDLLVRNRRHHLLTGPQDSSSLPLNPRARPGIQLVDVKYCSENFFFSLLLMRLKSSEHGPHVWGLHSPRIIRLSSSNKGLLIIDVIFFERIMTTFTS